MRVLIVQMPNVRKVPRGYADRLERIRWLHISHTNIRAVRWQKGKRLFYPLLTCAANLLLSSGS